MCWDAEIATAFVLLHRHHEGKRVEGWAWSVQWEWMCENTILACSTMLAVMIGAHFHASAWKYLKTTLHVNGRSIARNFIPRGA